VIAHTDAALRKRQQRALFCYGERRNSVRGIPVLPTHKNIDQRRFACLSTRHEGKQQGASNGAKVARSLHC